MMHKCITVWHQTIFIAPRTFHPQAPPSNALPTPPPPSRTRPPGCGLACPYSPPPPFRSHTPPYNWACATPGSSSSRSSSNSWFHTAPSSPRYPPADILQPSIEFQNSKRSVSYRASSQPLGWLTSRTPLTGSSCRSSSRKKRSRS